MKTKELSDFLNKDLFPIITKEKRKYRTCLSETATNCTKTVYGLSGDRICGPCKYVLTKTSKYCYSDYAKLNTLTNAYKRNGS